jgi:hypothetical protein
MRLVLMSLAFDAVAIGLFAPRMNGTLLRRVRELVIPGNHLENAAPRECVVEQRTWHGEVEVVSHVNYSQLARVCRSRGLQPDAPALRGPRHALSRRELPAALRGFPASFGTLSLVR